MIEWTIEFQHVDVDDDFHKIVRIAARFTENIIREIEEWSEKLLREVEEAIASPPPLGEQRVVEFTLTLTVPDMGEFYQELKRLKRL